MVPGAILFFFRFRAKIWIISGVRNFATGMKPSRSGRRMGIESRQVAEWNSAKLPNESPPNCRMNALDSHQKPLKMATPNYHTYNNSRLSLFRLKTTRFFLCFAKKSWSALKTEAYAKPHPLYIFKRRNSLVLPQRKSILSELRQARINLS